MRCDGELSGDGGSATGRGRYRWDMALASGEKKKRSPAASAALVRAGNGRLGQAGGLRQPRVAELLAGVLREQILHGERPDGSLLPAQDVMTREFGAS